MNFDLENVAPFLSELESKFKLGFDAYKLGEFANSIGVDKEQSIIVDIEHSLQKSKMEFRLFMGDEYAPDLYLFFEHQELADEVGDFMMEWAEARGM
jgi:hypothetical protein